jgi:ribonuclease E
VPETTPEPRLVTSTRRRTARRPAGPPAAAAEASVEPVSVPVEPAVPGHAPAETPEERGVLDPTSTDEPIATPDPEAEGVQDTDVTEDEDGEGGFSLVHVPIKRKGSRKR